jgi:AcrR family transcriptional regulator
VSVTPQVLGRPAGARGEETRRRIIAATMRCVAESGYARATIREIARAAGMTSGSLYHYFPNKLQLVKAAFLELAEVSVPRITAAVGRADGVMGKLIAVLDEADAVLSDFPFAVAFDRAIRVEGGELADLVQSSDSIFGAVYATVAAIIEQARDEGLLGPEADADAASMAVFAVLRGLYEQAAVASPEDYHATVRALKLLIGGRLFDYGKLG